MGHNWNVEHADYDVMVRMEMVLYIKYRLESIRF